MRLCCCCQVITEAEGLLGRRVTNTAFFMFVSLGKDGRAQAIPPLICKGEEEEKRFDEGRKRYLARKEEREETYKALQQRNMQETQTAANV